MPWAQRAGSRRPGRKAVTTQDQPPTRPTSRLWAHGEGSVHRIHLRRRHLSPAVDSARLGIARAAGSGVLPQPAGVLVAAERFQVVGERAGGGERVGVVRAEPAAVEVVGVLEQGAGRPRLPTRPQVRPRGAGAASPPRGRRRRAGGRGRWRPGRAAAASATSGSPGRRGRGPQEPDAGSRAAAILALPDDHSRRARVQLHGSSSTRASPRRCRTAARSASRAESP